MNNLRPRPDTDAPSRTRLDEELGGNPYRFIYNTSVNKVDYLGLQCCLITIRRGDYSKWSHSILSCDNGAYISHSVGGVDDAIWRSKEMDDRDYPESERSYTCFGCLDEAKVSQWLSANRDRSWGYGDNCADVVLEAIQFSLQAPRAKPRCPCIDPELALKGCRSYARNVLEQLPNGTTPGITLPGDAERRAEEFVANGCNKWKCTVSCLKFPGGQF